MPRRPRAAIADSLALLDGADLCHARLEIDHRLHRRIGFGRRVDAVERCARPDQIEMELGPEEDAGGIGQRSGNTGKQRCNFAEGGDLPAIDRVAQHLGIDKMAHHQREAVLAALDPCLQRLRVGDAEAETVHAGIDMDRRKAFPSAGRAERIPLGKLHGVAEHGTAVELGVLVAGSREESVEHIDRRGRRDLAHGAGFIERGDEKGSASGLRQRAAHLRDPAAIGVGFHDSGAIRRNGLAAELAPVGDNGIEVDGQKAGGSGGQCVDGFRIGGGGHRSTCTTGDSGYPFEP